MAGNKRGFNLDSAALAGSQYINVDLSGWSEAKKATIQELSTFIATLGDMITGGSNVGGENEIFKSKSGSDLQFRTLKAGTNVTITQNTNDVEIAASGGGASPLTTKGDLYGFSTIDSRIPIGTNNQVLTADSSQALGVKWATPAGGGHNIYSNDVLQTTRSGLNFTDFTVNDSAGDDWNEVVHLFGDEANVDNTNQAEGTVKVYDATNAYYTDQAQEEFSDSLLLSQANISADGQMAVYIPAGYKIEHIFVNETASAAAGNISIGTAASGTQIVNAYTVGADADEEMTLASDYFSRTADQNIYISSSAWGSGVVDILIKCEKIW